MTPGDYARFERDTRFEWDTGRRVRTPGQAPKSAVNWWKVFYWTFCSLILVAAIIAGGIALFCYFALASAS